MTDAVLATSGRKARGAYAKTGEKRIAILDAALEVFAQSGYRSGSLRDVAARVGMSEAGLLHHFPSKVKLLEAVLDRRDELSRGRIDSETNDGGVTLRDLVSLAAHNASVPGVVELYCTLSAEATSPDHPAHRYFIQRYEYTRDMFDAAFRKLERDGRLRPGHRPRQAAIAAIALWDGLQIQWLLDRDVVDMATELGDFLESMIDGGLPPAAEHHGE